MEEFESLKNKFKGSNKYMITLDYEEIKRIIEITENLIARNKELEKSYVEEAQLFLNTLNYYYIPKSKIRKKIEEYEEDVKDFEEYWSKDPRKFKRQKSIDYYKLEALKELLQEGDK